ncbi:MAG: prepilin peptidase, partial [Desulfotomaculales bacterium]
DWWGGFLGALVWFTVGVAMAATGGLGGGDIKFMAAVGAWAGVYGGLLVFVASQVIGMLWIVYKFGWKFFAQKLFYSLHWIGSLFSGARQPLIIEKVPRGEIPEHAVPFAGCFAVGVWVLFIGTYFCTLFENYIGRFS